MAIVPIEIKGVVKRIRAVDASPEHKDIALQVLLEMLAKQIPPQEKPQLRPDLVTGPDLVKALDLVQAMNDLERRLTIKIVLMSAASITIVAVLVKLL